MPMPPKKRKYYLPTSMGGGLTSAGVAWYRRNNPGSKLQTAVTEKVPRTEARKKRRQSFCARMKGLKKLFPKAASDPDSRINASLKRWRC